MSRASDAGQVDTDFGTLKISITNWITNNGAPPDRAALWLIAQLCYLNAGCARYIHRHTTISHDVLSQIGNRTFSVNDNTTTSAGN